MKIKIFSGNIGRIDNFNCLNILKFSFLIKKHVPNREVKMSLIMKEYWFKIFSLIVNTENLRQPERGQKEIKINLN